MSVAEIKAGAAQLSVQELNELSRFFREQALRKDPVRREQVARAVSSDDWIVREEFEKRLGNDESTR